MVVTEENTKLLIHVICSSTHFILHRKTFYDRHSDADKLASVIKKYGVIFGYISGY